MNDLEVFDKDGKALNIQNVITDFLKNNLTVEISADTEYDFGNPYIEIGVKILLNGEEICSSGASINNIN